MIERSGLHVRRNETVTIFSFLIGIASSTLHWHCVQDVCIGRLPSRIEHDVVEEPGDAIGLRALGFARIDVLDRRSAGRRGQPPSDCRHGTQTQII